MNRSGLGEPEYLSDRFLVLIPVLNDWDPLELRLGNLDRVLHAHEIATNLLIVDDGSTLPPGATFRTAANRSLGPIELVRLRWNLGHYRAIAIGLAQVPCRAVVIMDGNGEDDPGDVDGGRRGGY